MGGRVKGGTAVSYFYCWELWEEWIVQFAYPSFEKDFNQHEVLKRIQSLECEIYPPDKWLFPQAVKPL